MGRLTNETLDNAISVYKTVVEAFENNSINDEDYNPMLDKCTLSFLEELKDYRQKEEQGLLLKLPCKVGDVVYQITRDIVSEFRIKTFVCDNKTFFFHWECIKGIYKNVVGFHSSRIGVDVFLTKEEAEKALAEMRKHNE